jgi:hypothetical protein
MRSRGGLWRHAIPDLPRLWRIADFSSPRLVINIEFFQGGEQQGEARRPRGTRGASETFSRWYFTEEWYVLVGGLKKTIYAGGARKMRAQIFQASLQTTVHSSPSDVLLSSSRILRRRPTRSLPPREIGYSPDNALHRRSFSCAWADREIKSI